MPTYQIHIEGIVQGVGFRPYVYQSALRHGIRGTVQNGANGVVIQFNLESATEAQKWLDELLGNTPPLSRISAAEVRESSPIEFGDFAIIESCEEGSVDTPLTPDFAMCAECRREIDNKEDRRFAYAFITCTQCGPRYSITRKVPYDRPVTTMEPFAMCPSCDAEYHDPTHRRHFSQTNSCPDCAIRLDIYDTREQIYFPFHRDRDKIDFVVSAIQSSQIVAVKGVGGYLLLCDATDDIAVSMLRRNKHRPHKPMAVMYASLDRVSQHFQISKNEGKALSGPEAPIVLLTPKRSCNLSDQVAPDLQSIGVMLPCAPLLYLISQRAGRPLVATSANISGSPIIYDDQQAIKELSHIADWIVSHNREILAPQDDSVVRFTPKHDQRIVLRRSRGFAPNYFGVHPDLQGMDGVLAIGADLKGAIGLVHKKRTYLSQYLGSMDHLDSQQSFAKVLRHLTSVLGFEPKYLLSDEHPGYFGYAWCEEQKSERSLTWNRYQHHQAHLASVLAENEMLITKGPVLGFVWDGTGLSPDQQIWGSETFLWDGSQMHHCNNIGLVPHLSGDQLARQPRLALLAFTDDERAQEKYIKPCFATEEWRSHLQVKAKATILTSSMGRLFDAVSCLLTGTKRNTFEGQAAMYLESLALKGKGRTDEGMRWRLTGDASFYRQAMENVFSALEKKIEPSVVAYLFHDMLVQWVAQQAQGAEVQYLAFSGGVFQNALLVDLLIDNLSDKYDLLFHKELAPNDENIAHGQLMLEWIHRTRIASPAVENQVLKNEVC